MKRREPADVIDLTSARAGREQAEAALERVRLLCRRLLAAGDVLSLESVQMLEELGALPDPDDPGRTLLEGIELIVPHQANKTMILNLAGKAGLSADQMYFNVDKMGNVSAASIPIAVYDAVRDGVISRRTRIRHSGTRTNGMLASRTSLSA